MVIFSALEPSSSEDTRMTTGSESLQLTTSAF